MSGSEPNDIEFRRPRMFIRAQSVRELPKDDGGQSRFFSRVVVAGRLDVPGERRPEAGEPGPDRLQRDRLGTPDRHQRRHLQAVRRAVHDEGVVGDRDRAVREVDPPTPRRDDVAQAHDVVDAAQQLELPRPEGGRLGHGRRDRAVDAQHDAGVLQPEEQVRHRCRRPCRLHHVGDHAEVDDGIRLDQRPVEHPGIAWAAPSRSRRGPPRAPAARYRHRSRSCPSRRRRTGSEPRRCARGR